MTDQRTQLTRETIQNDIPVRFKVPAKNEGQVKMTIEYWRATVPIELDVVFSGVNSRVRRVVGNTRLNSTADIDRSIVFPLSSKDNPSRCSRSGGMLPIPSFVVGDRGGKLV
jgi:hypothetical protein